jgi:hypothetical protein
MAPDLVEQPDDRAKSTGRIVGVSFAAMVACAAAAALFYVVTRSLKAHHASDWAVLAATGVFFLVIISIALLDERLRRGSTASSRAPATQRYRRRLLVGMIAYLALLLIALGVHLRAPDLGPLAYLVAAAPAAPLLGVIGAMGLYFREETDEFQRMLMTQACLWATGGVLAITTVWGFLEMFGLAPNVPGWAIFPLWSALLGPASLIIRRRY